MRHRMKPRKPDYIAKAFVIKNGIDKSIRLINHDRFILDTYQADNMSDEEYYKIRKSLDNRKQYIFKQYGFEMIEEANRVNDASYHRTMRLKSRILKMLEYSFIHPNYRVVFITYTFNDEYLSATREETRRHIIAKFNNQNTCDYIGNIDYGGQNGREHYHVVALIDKDIPLLEYRRLTRGSSVMIEIVRHKDHCDSERLAKYTGKLTNHAIKETTKRNHLIYKRKPCYNEGT